MTCEELRDCYELYAFGTLEEPERAELRAHLDRGCPTCTAEMGRAHRLAAHLALAVPPAEPPAHLRSGILARAGAILPAQSAPAAGAFWKWAFATGVAAALILLMVAVSTFRQTRSLEQELERLRSAYQSQRHRERELLAQVSAYQQALRLITAPGGREIRFGPQQPSGRVFVKAQGLVLIAADFPQPPRGRAYELWLIAANRPAPIPAGVFSPDAGGHAVHIWQKSIEVGSLKALAVSDEPPGGVPAPTGKIILTVPMR